MNNVDSIRLEQFRQIRKEIRGSNEYLVVGIDIAWSDPFELPRSEQCNLSVLTGVLV